MLKRFMMIAVASFAAGAAQAQEAPDVLVKRVVDDITSALRPIAAFSRSAPRSMF